MSPRSYVHPSRVELRETAGHRPSRDELVAERELADRRRDRAHRARTRIRGTHHDHT